MQNKTWSSVEYFITDFIFICTQRRNCIFALFMSGIAVFLYGCAGSSMGTNPSQSLTDPSTMLFLLISTVVSIILATRAAGESTAKKMGAILSLIFGAVFMVMTIFSTTSAVFFVLNEKAQISIKRISEEIYPLMFAYIPTVFYLIAGMRLYAWRFPRKVLAIVSLTISFLLLVSVVNMLAIFRHPGGVPTPYVEELDRQYEKSVRQPEAVEERPAAAPELIVRDDKTAVPADREGEKSSAADTLDTLAGKNNVIPVTEEERHSAGEIARLSPFDFFHSLAFFDFLFLALGILYIMQHFNSRKRSDIAYGIFLRRKKYSNNPLLSVWFRPRESYRAIRERYSQIYLVMIITAASTFVALSFISASNASGEKALFSNIIIKNLPLSILAGAVTPLVGLGLQYISGLLGGKGTWRNNVAAIATTNLPNLIILPLWAIILFTLGKAAIVLVLFILLYNIVQLWQFIILLHSISEANNFSKWRSFISMVILYLCIVICYLPLRLLYRSVT